MPIFYFVPDREADTFKMPLTAERLLRSLGASVTEETISPWRFDTARNRSMELIPPEQTSASAPTGRGVPPRLAGTVGAGLVPRGGTGHLSLHLVLPPDGLGGGGVLV